ncbi:MAG: hypothetical protein V4510_04355 [bacterium]
MRRALAPLILLFVLPPVAAGPGDMPATFMLSTTNTPTSALEPGGAPMLVNITWVYSMSQAAAAEASAQGSTTLHWAPAPTCSLANVTVTGELTHVIQFSSASQVPQTQFSGRSTFNVAAGSTADRGARGTCQFTAYVDSAGPNIPATTPSTTLAPVTVAARNGDDVRAVGSGIDEKPAPGFGLWVALGALAVILLAARRR